MIWIVRWLTLYAVAVPLVVVAVAVADPTGETLVQAAEKAPVIGLVILFSSSVLAGASALFWKIYSAQINQTTSAISALHEHVAILSGMKELLQHVILENQRSRPL